ncbi:thiaminase II [Flavobacterium sp. SM2513]|uniref:thiaminase II n=1 Tax=Flavobacterium sp. SM2513 TaxID=3424766 RepID=UPI003D7FF755
MNWSTNAWEQIEPIYKSIVEMPFITELMEGTLELEKFQFYMAQDSFYLEHFGRSLSSIASRINDIDDALIFMKFAEGALVVEKALHESYFKDFKVTSRGIIEPTCHHYVHFLKSTTALASIPVAVAAIVPCFWIYKEVGTYIFKHQNKAANGYQKWIDTYSGVAFEELATSAIAIADRLAADGSEREQTLMTEAFITASRLEFEFWNSAYQLKRW